MFTEYSGWRIEVHVAQRKSTCTVCWGSRVRVPRWDEDVTFIIAHPMYHFRDGIGYSATENKKHRLFSLPGKPRCPNMGTNPGQLSHLFLSRTSVKWCVAAAPPPHAPGGARRSPPCQAAIGPPYSQQRGASTSRCPIQGWPQPQAAQP